MILLEKSLLPGLSRRHVRNLLFLYKSLKLRKGQQKNIGQRQSIACRHVTSFYTYHAFLARDHVYYVRRKTRVALYDS